MNIWFANVAVLVNVFAYMIIRAPHGHRSSTVKVTEDRKGPLEIALLIGALLGTTVVPILWMTTSLLAVAEYPLHPVPYAMGIVSMLAGLWLFQCSHRDLGTNWSVTLQMRENHNLVTSGVYSRIRHPMYSSMLLLGIAQLLFLPNWIAGPAYLATFGLLYLLRVGREENMMQDRFGKDYEQYMLQTGRVVPRFRRPHT